MINCNLIVVFDVAIRSHFVLLINEHSECRQLWYRMCVLLECSAEYLLVGICLLKVRTNIKSKIMPQHEPPKPLHKWNTSIFLLNSRYQKHTLKCWNAGRRDWCTCGGWLGTRDSFNECVWNRTSQVDTNARTTQISGSDAEQIQYLFTQFSRNKWNKMLKEK